MMLALALAQDLAAIPVSFRYAPESPVQSVSVAGTFNTWNRSANPMRYDGSTWTITLSLKPGEYQYKFVVNGESWITDPNGKTVDDGYGHQNTYLLVEPKDFSTPAKVGDGHVTQSVLQHRAKAPDLNYDQGRLRARISVRPGDVKAVRLVANGVRVPTRRIRKTAIFETHEASIAWDRKQPVQYHFELDEGSAVYTFGKDGFRPGALKNSIALNPKTYQPIRVPAWVERSVFYQIFPDRFANGRKDNDPKELAAWTDEPTYWNRYGGDAAGVQQKLPYLKGLGVNGIYLNPVMMAPSNHRYDPVDFYRVDPEFGTNSEFAAMTKALQSQGVRVVLDQIFDHVGTTFAPFADLLRFQEKSRYRDWFTVREWPVEIRRNPPYDAWSGAESMPKVNVMHPEVKSYLLESVDYWMRTANLSGWRLDVANEVPHEFWREFRPYVKQRNPDAWILGEVWTDGTPWLGGDQWDASMNYPFRAVVMNWVAKGQGSPSQFVQNLLSVYDLTVPQVSRNQMNLLSSHDTPRFLNECGGDARLAWLGAVVQFTWPGVPSIYYGEELGMEGGADPQNRRAMRWDLAKAQNPTLARYRQLISLRTKLPILAAGAPEALPSNDSKHVAAYARRLGSDLAAVALNRSEDRVEHSFPLGKSNAGKSFIEAFSRKSYTADPNGTVRVALGPMQAALVLSATPAHLAIVRGSAAPTSTQEPNLNGEPS